jgi:hypothetical protein
MPVDPRVESDEVKHGIAGYDVVVDQPPKLFNNPFVIQNYVGENRVMKVQANLAKTEADRTRP